jgi:outer membrane protein OmpA-like peptidoglycan-associated protein
MKKILLILMLIIIVVSPSRSEEEKRLYYLGGYMGYNANLHFSDFSKLDPLPNCCPKFNSGDGGGIAIGLFGRIELTPSVLLGLRIGYTQMDGTLSRIDTSNNVTVVNNGNEVVRDLELKHSIDASFPMITLEPTSNFFFFKSLSTTVGFRMGYMMGPTIYQEERIQSPTDVTFMDNRIIRNDINADLEKANNFQVHGVIGFGMGFPIFGNATITPEVRYYLPLMNVSDAALKEDGSQGKWEVSQLQMGASLQFPIFEEITKEVVEKYKFERDTIFTTSPDIEERFTKLIDRDTTIHNINFDDKEIVEINVKEEYETVLPQESYIQVSIKAVGIDENGKEQEVPKIVIEEIEMEEGFPLLPYIFFQPNSSDLAMTGLNLLTKPETESFAENNMNWNTMDIYSDMLNILGERLTKNSKAKITIVGNNNNLGNEANNLLLSQARADQVKDYLVDVWGINKSRIKTQKRNLPKMESNNERPDGQVENQRAEIVSNDLSIIQPVYLKDIRKRSSPPVVMLIPYVNSDKDIAEWSIGVEQDGKTIRQYSGQGDAEIQQWSVIEEPVPVLEKPIDLRLEATNEKGKKAVASTQLQIEQKTIRKKREIIKDDKKFERYSLIVFDYDKSELTKNHKRVLDQIKKKIDSGAEVVISGYTDRTGELEYNKQLAQRRCDEVKKYLNLNNNNVKLNPIGSDKLLYDNDLPQGRYYSRTVKIEIITPIK